MMNHPERVYTIDEVKNAIEKVCDRWEEMINKGYKFEFHDMHHLEYELFEKLGLDWK